MINKQLISAFAIGLACLVILMFVSISTAILAVLLGLLIIPPVLVFSSVIMEGIPIILEKLRDLKNSGKNFFVVSVSKESITLEPQFR